MQNQNVMYCQNCGSINENDNDFCINCGMKIEKEIQPVQQIQENIEQYQSINNNNQKSTQ